MNIENPHNAPYNFDKALQPLFDAMKEGRIIKSITCMRGTMNKDKPLSDFTLTNVKASDYYVGMGSNHKGNEHYDFVDTNNRSFYMNWVRTFEL